MRSGTIAILLGITLFQQMPWLPDGLWLALLSSALVISSLLLRRYLAILKWPVLACTGFAWAWFYALFLVPSPLPVELEGEELSVVGHIASLPENLEQLQRFVFAIDSATLDRRPVSIPGRLRLSWYHGKERVGVGQQWQLKVKLKRPHGMSNPAGLDYEAWLYQQGIRATGYVRQDTANRLLTDSVWQYPLQRVRARYAESLALALKESPVAGLVTALAIGERQGIGSAQWQVLTATGTNHLMAISGLHIGLVAGMLFTLVSQMWRLSPALLKLCPAVKAGAVAGLLGAACYAALAGFAIPTQRALVMVAVVMAALWLQRTIQPYRLLAVALLVVIVHDPRSIMSSGFWLSFAAVAVILYAMSNRRMVRKNLWWQWGRVQWVIALGLLPVMVLFFQQASLSAPLANLIAVPITGLIVVPLTLAGTVMLPLFPIAGDWLVQAAAWITEWLYLLLEWGAVQVPSTVLPLAPFWSLLLSGLGLFILLAPRGIPGRWLGLALMMPMLTIGPSRPEAGHFRLVLLDVGQGLAAVVQTRGHLLLFDTGPRFSPQLDAAQAAIIPLLKQQGGLTIDVLVLSHDDMDHAGGLSSLLQTAHIALVMSSTVQSTGTVPQRRCAGGQEWWWDGVHFEVLWPLSGEYADQRSENDNSCVVRVSTDAFSLLLTGDIEAAAERELVTHYGDELRSNVIVAPHHGSSTSSTAVFIDAVKPEYVLFSMGYRNRHGFPNPDVVERYHSRGVMDFRTAEQGAIILETGKPWHIQGYRSRVRHYWQDE